MQTIKLSAEPRKVLGRKVKKLRREGKVPANVFGKDIKSQSVSVDLKEFLKVYKEAGETKIVELTLGDKNLPTLIHSVQSDPVDDIYLHINFLQVNLKQKVTAQVPVEFVGESPAEKQGAGTVVKYIDEIEIEALPTDILEKFEIDLSKLEKVDDQVTVGDLKYDKAKIEVVDDVEKIIVKVEELRVEEPEPVVAVETPAEGEAVKEGETEEVDKEEKPEQE